VRNQGSCGGCYAFSTACSVEAAYKIKFGTLPRLSDQQLVDCTSRFGNTGCGGGLMTNSFKYLQKFKHMDRDSYPYSAQQGKCQYDEENGVTGVQSFKTI
jgi:C1A family cysteine protease